MASTDQDESLGHLSEQEERDRRSSRRNLAGIIVVTFVSLGIIVGDIIKDLLAR